MRESAAKRSTPKLRGSEGQRALIVSLALAAILAMGALVTGGGYFSAERGLVHGPSSVTRLSLSSAGEAESRVASIVVETDKKGRCEERHFDNRTGKLVSANYVDCDARLEAERDTASSETINRERIRQILGAFKK
ncbi:MAG TPA: hypothetical protein VFP60_10940 [Pseudolabrys sp.]|nr:hypothetical protein [Pseudolabrys sp.]